MIRILLPIIIASVSGGSATIPPALPTNTVVEPIIESVPFPKEYWPAAPEITREIEDQIVAESRRIAPGQDVVVGGPSTKGTTFTRFAGLTIKFPEDVESGGIVIGVTCAIDVSDCPTGPYLAIKREGGGVAFIMPDGTLRDPDNLFSDVEIIK